MAHAPAWSDTDRDVWRWSRPALGWACRGDSAGRRHLDSARREALAWRITDDGDDAHRDSGKARWEACGLARKRHGSKVRRTLRRELVEDGEGLYHWQHRRAGPCRCANAHRPTSPSRSARAVTAAR